MLQRITDQDFVVTAIEPKKDAHLKCIVIPHKLGLKLGLELDRVPRICI